MNNVSAITKVKLTGLWKRTDKNGQVFMGGSLSPVITMMVFKEKKYSEKSPDYAAFLRSSFNDNGSNGKNTVRVKLAGLWTKTGADGTEYLEGKTAPGCYLRIERQIGNSGGLNSPEYIAYFCGYDNGTGFLGDSTGGGNSSSNNGNTGNSNDEEVYDYDTSMDESHGFTEDEIIF